MFFKIICKGGEKMEKEIALDLWDKIYGENCKWHVDCFGTWMYRDDYGDTDKKRSRPNGAGKMFNYGWEIDHIRPKSDYDNESNANFNNNYEPMHWQNNREKADCYPQFSIDDIPYSVVKCEICGQNGVRGYGIVCMSDNTRVDWKAKMNKYFVN